MRVGAFYFPADYGINHGGAGGEGRWKTAASIRCLSQSTPTFRPAASRPSRAAASCPALLPYPRSVRGALLCRRGNQEAQARHRHPAGAAARADRDGQGHRLASTSCRAAALSSASAAAGTSRRWRTTARRIQDALQADARACAGDEGAVDQGRSLLRRRVREVRPRLVVAQAGAAAASADHPGRRDRPYAAPRHRVLRRLVPAPARRLRCRARAWRICAEDGREGGPRFRRRSPPSCSARPTTPRRWRATTRPASKSALLAVPDDSRDEILRYLDKIAPLAKLAAGAHDRRHRPRPDGVPLQPGRATIGAGSISARRAVSGSLWQTDRLVSSPADPGMHGGDGRTCRPHAAACASA